MTGVTTTVDLLGRLVDDYAAGLLDETGLMEEVAALPPAPDRRGWGVYRVLGRL